MRRPFLYLTLLLALCSSSSCGRSPSSDDQHARSSTDDRALNVGDRADGRSGKEAFYNKALILAQESYEGRMTGKGPWMKINADSARNAQSREGELAALEHQLDAAAKTRSDLSDRIESQYTEYPILKQIDEGKYQVRRMSNGIYQFNTWTTPFTSSPPRGVDVQYDERKITDGIGRVTGTKKEIRQVLLTPEASKAMDRVDEYRSELNLDIEHESLVFRASTLREEINRLKSPAYSMSVADVIKRLGTPNSIIKNDFNRQLWVYRFPDGAVEIHVDGLGDLDRKGTIVQLVPQNVNKI
ncbi:MAG: hypothetical protein FJ276_29690 [Planctomycetes bacterium]|nr:hypothetical protein [Planctomycetota bacterium]